MINKMLIILLLFLCITACNRDEPSYVVENHEREKMPDQEGWNSTVTSTKNGRLEAIVRYGHMQRYSERKIVKFDEGIVVDFFDPSGRNRSQLTAIGGMMNERTDEINALGQVVVKSDTGVTLFTEKLNYDQKAEKIFTNEAVTVITEKGDTLYGTGFVSDAQLRNWRIEKPSGRAHTGVDLTAERWERKQAVSDSAKTDSTQKRE